LKARFEANEKHNNKFICFSTRIITTFFCWLLRPLYFLYSIDLYDISYQHISIEYPRMTWLTSKEYIYNMYIIYIPELDISSLFLFYQIFCRSYLGFPLRLEESININCGVNHLTHSPKDVSQILMALDFAHWGGSPSSYNWRSSRFYSLAFFWYSKTI
jgi:hypothetical protein